MGSAATRTQAQWDFAQFRWIPNAKSGIISSMDSRILESYSKLSFPNSQSNSKELKSQIQYAEFLDPTGELSPTEETQFTTIQRPIHATLSAKYLLPTLGVSVFTTLFLVHRIIFNEMPFLTFLSQILILIREPNTLMLIGTIFFALMWGIQSATLGWTGLKTLKSQGFHRTSLGSQIIFVGLLHLSATLVLLGIIYFVT